MIEFTGLVTKAFASRNGNVVEITNGETTFSFIYHEVISLGIIVEVLGELEPGYNNRLIIKQVRMLKNQESEAVQKMINQTLENQVSLTETELLVKDEITSLLDPLFRTAARQLVLAQKLNRFIVLKFHADADGISGAFAITSFLRCTAHQSNSAVYTAKDAIRDLNLVHHEYKPLLILLDMGANEESKEGLQLLRAANVEVVIIDHHPPMADIASYVSLFVSPWAKEVSGSRFPASGTGSENTKLQTENDNLSAYPAGYLAVEIARKRGQKVEFLAPISCAGDKSKIMPVSEEDKKKALVLDFLAINSGYGNNLAFYKGVFEKEELFYSILSQAREKIESISASVKKTLKTKHINGLSVHIVDLDHLSVQHEFPSRGKIATFIFEDLDHSQPHVVIGVSDRTIIFRINDQAVAKGVQADTIISRIKATHGDFILSGGGHARAAAMRIREGFSSVMVDAICKILEAPSS